MLSTNVFVLSYKNVGERDRRYSLLTQEFGRVQVIVKSILKPNSKLAGHLEPPSFSWVELIENGDGFQLTQALEQKSFSSLRKNPEAAAMVLRLTKFLDGFLGYDSNSKIYFTWNDFLAEVEKASGKNDVDWQFFEAQLILPVLKELGFLPDIAGKTLGKEFYFEYQKVLGGEIFFESSQSSEFKKLAFYFKEQAQSYML